MPQRCPEPLDECVKFRRIQGRGWVTGRMSLVDVGQKCCLAPVGTVLRQVPAVIVAVKLPVIALAVEPLVVATPTPIVEGINASVATGVVDVCLT